MNKEKAAQLLALAESCTNTMAAAISDVRERAPGLGADYFESSAHSTLGNVILGFMAPVWDEYPDLVAEPGGQREAAYDPDRFSLPKEVVVDSFRALGKARELMGEIRTLIDTTALEGEERRRFELRLAEVDEQLRQARFAVAEQHADFRGPHPKERIPE